MPSIFHILYSEQYGILFSKKSQKSTRITKEFVMHFQQNFYDHDLQQFYDPGLAVPGTGIHLSSVNILKLCRSQLYAVSQCPLKQAHLKIQPNVFANQIFLQKV